MAKKCIKCGVPLEGLGYKYIAHLIFRVEPSKKKKRLCNKCDRK